MAPTPTRGAGRWQSGDHPDLPAVLTALRALPTPSLVAIDGFSGAGKSSLGEFLAAALGWQLVALDDFVPGWDGLAAGVRAVRDGLAEPFARGQAGRLRRWDWTAGRPGALAEFSPNGSIILEGSGALAATRGFAGFTIWIDVDEPTRSARLRSRWDFPYYEPHLGSWADQERRLAADLGPAAADIVLRA